MALARLVRPREARSALRPFPSMSFDAWQNLFSFNGSQYLSGSYGSMPTRQVLAECIPAFAALDRRASIVGDAWPMFQRLERGRPTEMFSTPELAILHRPWRGGTWRMLTAIMETDVAAAGNSYWMREADELIRLDPDTVTILVEAALKVGVDGQIAPVGERLLGYAVQRSGEQVAMFGPDEIAHYRPGCPTAQWYRGESWLAAAITDSSSDISMTRYKQAFLRNGAMPSMAILYDPTVKMAALEAYIPKFEERYAGQLNAGKVLHMLGGRDVKTVGATLDQLAYKAVQGAGETRIAMAAGVPSVVQGGSESLAGSSLTTGNYAAARRLFADAKMRPLLGSLFESLSRVVRAPNGGGWVGDANGVRLWHDDSQVSFFQEDVADEATIRQTNAVTIRQLIEVGYEPDAAVQAVTSGNFKALLGAHTGLTSVQLQPPGTTAQDDEEPGPDEPEPEENEP